MNWYYSRVFVLLSSNFPIVPHNAEICFCNKYFVDNSGILRRYKKDSKETSFKYKFHKYISKCGYLRYYEVMTKICINKYEHIFIGIYKKNLKEIIINIKH